jgi:hypothetical protein
MSYVVPPDVIMYSSNLMHGPVILCICMLSYVESRAHPCATSTLQPQLCVAKGDSKLKPLGKILFM